MKQRFLFCLSLLLFFAYIGEVKAVYTDSNVGNFEQELAKFPCDYQEKIKTLHNIYPNAVFVAQNKFFDWNYKKEVEVKWSDMLAAETKGTKSLIYSSAPSAYKTGSCAQTSGGICVWYVASNAGVSYYLNPYNFLDETRVFMFESQFYSTYQTEAGVEKILQGSFMANKTCGGSNNTYAKVILDASSRYNVSPYMIASRLVQEQGTNGTSGLISGNHSKYPNYYNYFNIKASGPTDAEVIENGLKYAKDKNWNTPYESIVGGTKFIREEYVGINDTYNVKGQMTGYLQKWDPYGPVYAGHQYMQNIQSQYSESYKTYQSYASTSGYKNYKYIFYIPIFVGAPNTTNTSCNNPISGNDNPSTENPPVQTMPYKVSGNYVSGIAVGTDAKAIISKTNGKVTNPNGSNKTSGKIVTGDKIISNGKTYDVVIYGDVNGDGQIKATDYMKIKNHIMGSSKLSGAYAKAADVNKDGQVRATDYVKIKNNIMYGNQINQ